jgi:hypothetical protein
LSPLKAPSLARRSSSVRIKVEAGVPGLGHHDHRRGAADRRCRAE